MRRIIVHTATKTEKIPVCGYVRVSTDKDEQAESYHLQERYWTNSLMSNPNYQFIGVFGDEAISGSTQQKRPGFLEMLKACRMGKVKRIFTKSVARFGRNSGETLRTIKELKEMGVSVLFENDGIDTSQLSDELLLRLKSILAEEELKTMSKNVIWSARKRFREGSVELVHLYGYDIIREDKRVRLQVNQFEASVVRRIFKMYLDGMGFQRIANTLDNEGIRTKHNNLWGKTQISDILRQEKYIGDALLQKNYSNAERIMVKNNGEVAQYYIENDHEPIIDRETFEQTQIQLVLRQNKIKEETKARYSELTGKITCAYCGKNYGRRVNSKIKNFGQAGWMCRTANSKGSAVCPSNTINEDLLKAMIVDAYNEYLATPKLTNSTFEVEQEITRLVQAENNLRQMWQEGKISYSTYMKNQRELKDRYKKCDEETAMEQGFELYNKEGKVADSYSPEIVQDHIEKIIMDGFKVKFIFKNKQEITKEWKYEHRKYCKAY